MRKDLSWLGAWLAIDGDFVAAVPYGSGHINDTFAATYALRKRASPPDRHAGGSSDAGGAGGDANLVHRRFIHQRINGDVFADPAALMDNAARVTRHIHAKLIAEGAADIGRRVLQLVPSRDGADFVIDEAGDYWRTFAFIEGATTYDVVATRGQAFEVARAFGAFQQQLADLPPPPLAVTIPGFHDTPQRLAAFELAVGADAYRRAAGAAEEIRSLQAQAALAGALQRLQHEGALPLRIAHNDTKINNVLIDDETGEGICVIDLDTVMPGLALDDFGDLVRTSTCFAREDDRDLSKAVVQLPIFEGLVRGYLGAAAGFLAPAEVANLVLAGKVMTYETALRFLTDHLRGDTYFRIHHEGHNLDRARVQIALLASLTAHEETMQGIVETAAAEVAR
jgi:hypothetical protein